MKTTAFSFVAVLLLVTVAIPEEKQRTVKPPITLAEIRERSVMGELGVPLGTIVEISAEIIAGSTLRMKAYDGQYLLKVTHVAGKKLPEPTAMEFWVLPLSYVKLASDTFSLYELRKGEKAHSLTDEQITELEKGYVGKHVRLRVYETGGFSGVPKNMPHGLDWADTSFGFYTRLTVLGEEKSESK